MKLIREFEAGYEAANISREHGMFKATFHNWRNKYSGIQAQELKRLKELEVENNRLKRMYADLSLDHSMLKDILIKKF